MAEPEPSPLAAASRPSRWRLFQYRLRTLLIVTAIIAIALGWWSYRARQQRAAVAALRKTGATLLYDDRTYETSSRYVRTRPYQPEWLVDFLGIDFFANVIVVSLPTQTVDADLVHLRGLPALTELDLGRTQVTDQSMENLKYLTTLTELRLGNSKITDGTMSWWIGRSGSKITDAGLRFVGSLKSLRFLSVSGTHVTDVGLEHLRGLPELQILVLEYTDISDAGLEHLNGLTGLRILVLNNTKVTNAGVARLKQRLPQCDIRHVR